MQPFDILTVLEQPPHVVSDDGRAEFWILGDFNGGAAWVGRYLGTSPWTRHPDGDAFVHQVEGSMDLTVLASVAPVTTTVVAGESYIIPRGTWYRHHAAKQVIQYGAFVGGTEHHEGEEPPGVV